MRINSINKSMMRNFGSAVMNMALLASPFSTGAATNAYYASRRANYGRNNSYLIDDGLNNLKAGDWKHKLKANEKKTKLEKLWSADDLVLNKSVAVRELVVVDGHIHNRELFSKLIKPGVELLRIDNDGNGFDDLMNQLSNYQGLNAIHLFAHGQNGQVLLGNQLVGESTLQNTVQSFSLYNQTIQEGGELLIYNTQLESEGKDGDNLAILTGKELMPSVSKITFNAEDLEINKGDINAYPEIGSIARSMAVFSGTINFTEGKTSGSYAGGANTVDAEVYESSSKDYTLIIDGASKSTGTYIGAFYQHVYTSSGETAVTLKFDGSYNFDAENLTIYNSGGTTADFSIVSSAGTVVASYSLSAFAGKTIPLSTYSNVTGITTLTIDADGATTFFLKLDDFEVANLGASAADTDPPNFSSAPAVSAATGTGFDLDATIDETGDIFYVVVANGAGAPTVQEVIDGQASGGASALASGSATNTTTLDVTINTLDDGTAYDVYVVARDDEGTPNVQASTTKLDITTLDTTAPSTPGTPDLATSSDSGSEDDTAGSTSDNRTNDLTPQFTGTAEANSTITVTSSVDGQLGTTTADGSGNWSYTHASNMSTGAHTITVTATDAASNVSSSSSGLSITIDTSQPTVTVSTTSSDPTSDDPIPVTITFSEEVERFKENEITVSGTANGTTGDFMSSDSTTFTVNITPANSGTVIIDINAGVATDVAANSNTASNQLSLTYDGTKPTIQSVSLAADNSFIDVTFNEGVFDTGSGSGALETGDFGLGLSGGTATSPTISSVKKNDNTVEGSATALAGGETVVRVFFSFTGSPSGGETLTVGVFDNAIFDQAGNAANTSQSNNTATLNDETSPAISSVTLSSDNSFIDVIFSEGVFDTNGGSGAVESSDFDLSLTGGIATSPTVTSVTTTGGAGLSGGETTIRVNFSVTGTPDGGETLEVDITDGSSIFDAAGNAAAANQTSSNTASLNDAAGPAISSVSLAADNGHIDVTFSEGVFDTNGGSGAIETGDFSLSLTGGTATSPTVTTVTTTGGAGLSGGETTIRVNFSVTGTPDGGGDLRG